MNIISTNHSGQTCTLTRNGQPVNEGDTLADFRGEPHTIKGGDAPHKPSSAGKIYTDKGQFFTTVFDCRWTARSNDSGEPTEPPAVTAAAALAAKVDRLGALNAAAASIKKETDTLRADLEDAGLKDIDGALYRVNFAQCAGRTLVDWASIAAKLKPSRQLIAAHTKTGAESTRMTIKAHATH